MPKNLSNSATHKTAISIEALFCFSGEITHNRKIDIYFFNIW
jgi:hypothetical protein